MKTKRKILTMAMMVGAAWGLAGCIEETLPADGSAIESQIKDAGLESSINGISTQMTQGYLVYGTNTHEADMSYPMFMIASTEMMGDMYAGGSNSGYDWFRAFNCMNENMGSTGYYAYLPWRTLYMYVKSANDAIRTFKAIESPSQTDENHVAQAYAYRAFDYYMLMVYFEPKANIYTDCSKVIGLTVPIVTDETTEKQAHNNPRVSHETLMDFIIADLDKAEEIFLKNNYTASTRFAPDLAVVYGLKARAYMWDEQYMLAYEYADKAIKAAEAQGAEMMSKGELTNPNSAFAVATSGWMWYGHYSAENLNNLSNLAGMLSAEASWSYSDLTKPIIDASLFNKMNKSDYRRKQFLAPDRKKGDYQTCRDEDFLESAPDYLALKFRCANGNYKDYTVGAATDVPFMRLEEMYLLRAEAAGMSQGVGTGVTLLTDWVKKYRDPYYSTNITTERDLQLAVLDQMRLEFWGEAVAFFSAKRIQPGVMQYYEGTNAPANIYYINAEGIKPNWNFVIPNSEVQSNRAIQNNNNPDPTMAIDVNSAKMGVYAPGNY
ncbi:MAG: RagB/SusD family nutrient uptake outer membrane protein [Prevotella sp.]|nr:RagB/SusD family nutrient uptake outer membrane protein [Prevotella sp.]